MALLPLPQNKTATGKTGFMGLQSGGSVVNPQFGTIAPTNMGTAIKAGQVLTPQVATTLGVRASTPTNNIKPSTPTLPSQFQSNTPSVAGYYRQGNDVYDPQGGYVSMDMAKQKGIVSLLAGIPQKQAPVNQGYTRDASETKSNAVVNAGQVTDNGQKVNEQNNGLYGQLIALLTANALAPSNDYTAQQAEANKYNEALKQSRINEAKGLSANAQNPIPLEFQQGRAQVLQSQYAQEQAALGSAFQGASTLQGAANTQQGLQQQGLTSAAGMAQPVSQFGMLTNPLTGVPLNTQVFNGAISQAQQLVNGTNGQNGVPVTDPSVQQLLAPFGFIGPMAFNSAMQAQAQAQGGSWNPAAQSVGANQNLAFQGQTQQQAQTLSLGLQQLDALQPKILNFLNNSPLNPSGIPIWNEQIKTYLADMKNAGLTTQWNSMMNDIQNVAQQIISAKSPGTPTSTTEMAAAQDPSNLTGTQLKAVLDTWNNLGKTTLGVYQGANQQAGGAGNAYLGGSSQASSTIEQSPSALGYENSTAQGFGGIALNILKSPATLASWLISIFK
jgi:hypothetical protein